MPGADDVVIIGSKTTVKIGINIYDDLGACEQAEHPSLRGVETPEFCDSRRVGIAVEELQHVTGREEPGGSICRATGVTGSGFVYATKDDSLLSSKATLEKVVQAAASSRVSENGVSKLREIVRHQTSAFR